MTNTYTTIKTNAGLVLETAAQSGGDKITLTQMAIGDGGGNPVAPNAAQTALIREQVRVTLNAIAPSPDNTSQFTAEAIIPASAGGFTMREAGLYTSDGTLFAVANLPQVYKPTSREGAFGQVVVTMTFVAANATAVNLSVDENVSVATRLWVENYVTPAHVFDGGSTGQFLAKASNEDGAWNWVDPSAAVQVLVDTVEEDQTLAANQTAVTLSKVTANGLGVFINGVRLRDDEWTKVDNTHIALNKTRNNGDRITLVQNEQTGYSDVLRADRNLSDVDDADASVANLFGGVISVNRTTGTLSGKSTPSSGDRSKQFATTEFVQGASDAITSALKSETVRAQASESDKISGSQSAVLNGSDKRGQALHLNGSSGRAWFGYDGGGNDLAWSSDVSSEATARASADNALQSGVNDKISGSAGMASGDKRGVGMHLNGGSGRPYFGYDGGGTDVAWYSDVSAEASARASADNALQSSKMDKAGGTFTGDVAMSGHAIYGTQGGSRIQFEAGGHIAIRDNGNNLISWYSISDGNPQSFNVNVNTNVNGAISATQLNLPNDSQSPVGNFDLYAQTPFINFHYKNGGNIGSPNVAIINDGDGQLTLNAGNGVRIGGGKLYGTKNGLNVYYGNGNSYYAAFQNDGNYVLYAGASAFASFKDTGSTIRSSLTLAGGLNVLAGSVSFQPGAVSQGAVNGLSSSLNDKISGTAGMASGDKRGIGMHLNGGSGRPYFGYDGGGTDVAWYSDVSAEASARASADNALQSSKMDKAGGTFTGDVAMSGHAIYGTQGGSRIQFEAGGHIAIRDNGNNLISWYSISDGNPQSFNVNVNTNVNGAISATQLNLPNDSQSPVGNFDLYAQTPFINFHYKNGGGINTQIVNDGDGQLTLNAGNGVWIGGGKLYGKNNGLILHYGTGNSYYAAFQSDGNYVLYAGTNAFASFKDTGSFINSSLALNGNVSFNTSPTVPTLPTGTNDTRAASTAFVCGTSNGGTNGYMIHPNGMIEQWGVYTTDSSSGSVIVYFPVTFPHVCLNVTLSEGKAGGSWFGNQPTWHGVYDTPSTNNFEAVTRGFVNGNAGGAVSATGFYRAIGW